MELANVESILRGVGLVRQYGVTRMCITAHGCILSLSGGGEL